MINMSSPKVSVIIPIYNAEKYIRKCLDSILNQTYSNFEIIAINDGSSDNSKEILKEYKNKFPDKVIYIEQRNNGVSKTRNYGIKISTGKYVMFIDNDDYIDTNYIETYVRHAEENNYDIVVGGYRRPNETGKILIKSKIKNTEWCKIVIITPWAKIYKRDYLLKNTFEFLDSNIGEDIYFNLQALLYSNNIKIINYIGYNWFYNTNSISNTIHKSIKQIDLYLLLNSTFNILKEKEILDKHYEIIEMYFIFTIIWILLYSTKKLDYSTISKEYDKVFNWLNEFFPNYKNNNYLGIGKLKGEKHIFLILIFMFFHKIHLGKLIVYLYSKF